MLVDGAQMGKQVMYLSPLGIVKDVVSGTALIG